MALTDVQIRTAKPADKAYTLNDGLGLSLLVESNGSKGWRFRYRFDGKPRMMSFGTYPEISLAEARLKREHTRKNVANGINPAKLKKAERQAKKIATENTFESIAREWHKSKADRWSLRYRDEIIDTFEKDIFPFIGKHPIADIKPMEVLDTLKHIEKRGALEKMRKIRQHCGEVFRYAIITGRAEYNPAPDLASALATHQKQHFPFLKSDELPHFLQNLSGYTGFD